ncbi:15966_t:CDS:2, partial [Rhizophagus irregularis]
DVNELQDEYESVSSEEDCVLFGLEVGDVFESWDSAEKQVVYCAKNNGFECKFSGVYRAQKKADIEDTCEHESVRMNCPWNINLQLTSDLVYVTSLCNEHNHSLEKENFVSNHQLSPEILEEIKFLVNIGCGAGPIIRALQKRFPETNKSKSDAAKTFEKLMKLQREEHGWFVKARLEGEDNHLTGLFWMRPSQIEL